MSAGIVKLSSFLKLSRREFAALKTRSVATVIAVGMMFGVLLAVITVLQGLENAELKFAGEKTEWKVYILTSCDNREAAVVDGALAEAVENAQRSWTEIYGDLETRVTTFDNVAEASRYIKSESCHNSELITSQVAVYDMYEKQKMDLLPVTVSLLIIAGLILATTAGHIMDNNGKTIALYYSLGASKKQILMIYSFYLAEICFFAMIFAILLALIIAGAMTGVMWSKMRGLSVTEYQNLNFYAPILFGVNWEVLITIIAIYLTTPVAFLLSLDQLSRKNLMKKLRRD